VTSDCRFKMIRRIKSFMRLNACREPIESTDLVIDVAIYQPAQNTVSLCRLSPV
jgi:hypothetical protein